MKIIFDGTILVSILNKDTSRTGIFFSAYYLFLEMSKIKDVEILLYGDVKSLYALKKASLNDKNLSRVQSALSASKMSQWISYGFYLRSLFQLKNAFEMFFAKSFTLMLLIFKQISSLFDKVTLSKDETYVYFSPVNRVPSVFRNNPKIIKFTLLHDTIPLLGEEYCPVSKHKSFFEMFNSLNPNDYYFANSLCTKNDFIKYCSNIDPKKISVTYLGASDRFYPDLDEKKNKLIKEKYHIPKDKKYIFSLCSIEPRKNLLFVVENFIEFIKTHQIQDLVFVLGGGHWEEFIHKLEQKLDNLGEYKSKIIKAGYIDDKDLSNLYTHSLCSVYLSLYEGFGLPALEAMKCASPLIASNTASIPEVVGDGGLLIDPRDNKALQEAMEKIYFDPDFAKELSLRGIERAKKFSWEKCAQEMVEKMRCALEEKNLESKCRSK